MPATEEAQRDLVETVLNVNVHRHLGLTLHARDTVEKTAHASITTSAAHLTPTATLHGGIVNLLQDVVCYFAAIGTLEPGEVAATVSSSFQMIATVLGPDHKIDFHSVVLKKTRTMVFCQCRVESGGKVLATGTVTKMIIKPPKGKL